MPRKTRARRHSRRFSDAVSSQRMSHGKAIMDAPGKAQARDDVRLYLACCLIDHPDAFVRNIEAFCRNWLKPERRVDIVGVNVTRWMQRDKECQELEAYADKRGPKTKAVAKWMALAKKEVEAAG